MPGVDNISDFTLIEDGGSTTTTSTLVGFGEGEFGDGPFGGGQVLAIAVAATVWTDITTP